MEQGTHIGCGHSGPASWCRMLVSALALVALPSCALVDDIFGWGEPEPDPSYVVRQFGAGLSSEVLSLDVAPDGATAAAALQPYYPPARPTRAGSDSADSAYSFRIMVWSVEKGEIVWGSPPRIDGFPVGTWRPGTVRYSPDGSLLAAGRIGLTSQQNGVCVWRTSDWQIAAAVPHSAPAVAFSCDGSLLFTGGADRDLCHGDTVVFAWATSTWSRVAVLTGRTPWPGDAHYGPGQSIGSLHVSPEGSALCAGAAFTWDTNVWSVDPVAEQPAAMPDICDVVGFTETTSRVIAGGRHPGGRALSCVDIETGGALWTREDGRKHRCTIVSYDGRWIVAGKNDGTVSVFRAEDGRRVRYMDAGAGSITAIGISRDNGTIVAAALGGVITVLEPRLGPQAKAAVTGFCDVGSSS